MELNCDDNGNDNSTNDSSHSFNPSASWHKAKRLSAQPLDNKHDTRWTPFVPIRNVIIRFLLFNFLNARIFPEHAEEPVVTRVACPQMLATLLTISAIYFGTFSILFHVEFTIVTTIYMWVYEKMLAIKHGVAINCC